MHKLKTMKIYTSFSVTKADDGRLSIIIRPDSVSPKYRTYYILVAKELPLNDKGQIEQGQDVSLGLVGKEKKSYMLFPPSKKDNRALFLFNYPSPKHRWDGSINYDLSNFKETNLLFCTSGSGAWGAGVAGAVILEEGEYISNNSLTVSKNIGGELVTKSFKTTAEAQIWLGVLGEEDIQII